MRACGWTQPIPVNVATSIRDEWAEGSGGWWRFDATSLKYFTGIKSLLWAWRPAACAAAYAFNLDPCDVSRQQQQHTHSQQLLNRQSGDKHKTRYDVGEAASKWLSGANNNKPTYTQAHKHTHAIERQRVGGTMWRLERRGGVKTS